MNNTMYAIFLLSCNVSFSYSEHGSNEQIKSGEINRTPQYGIENSYWSMLGGIFLAILLACVLEPVLPRVGMTKRQAAPNPQQAAPNPQHVSIPAGNIPIPHPSAQPLQVDKITNLMKNNIENLKKYRSNSDTRQEILHMVKNTGKNITPKEKCYDHLSKSSVKVSWNNYNDTLPMILTRDVIQHKQNKANIFIIDNSDAKIKLFLLINLITDSNNDYKSNTYEPYIVNNAIKIKKDQQEIISLEFLNVNTTGSNTVNLQNFYSSLYKTGVFESLILILNNISYEFYENNNQIALRKK